MGVKHWFGSARHKPEDAPSARQAQTSEPPAVRVVTSLSVDPSIDGLVKMTGTTTIGADAVTALLRRRGADGRGPIEEFALLQREPGNPVDPQAVAVHVEGERIGYLPSYVAKLLPLAVGTAQPVPIQLFFMVGASGVRAEGWVWIGETRPKWQYSVESPPPLTAEEKRMADQRGRTQMVTEALAEGGARATQFRAGMVDGVHYLELIEPIKQLKREGRLQEALELCYRAIEGAEGDSQGMMPTPWYTEQAAIIHRQLGERDQEIAVLKRWLIHTPPELRDGTKIAERLRKLTG